MGYFADIFAGLTCQNPEGACAVAIHHRTLDSECTFIMADMIQALFLNLHVYYLCIGPPNQ